MLLIILISLISADYSSMYTETPSETISYTPGGKNSFIGVKGLKSVDDGIILRRSLDQGGIVYFLQDNKYPEWSFSYTITDIDLHFPEEGGVYLWYTTHDQEMGEFRGGSGTFEGLMAGIEFKGASPELVFAFNAGENYDDKIHETLYRDSFNADRLRGVKDLTVKIIVTKNNFKIELYDKDKLLYDSMRLISLQPHVLLGIGKRFSITSYYNYTSAEKAFKLTNAQLFQRDEHIGYDADTIHAENVSKMPVLPDDVMHPDKEMRHFIANFTHFMEYAKSVLGDTDDPSIKHYSTKIIEKVDKVIKQTESHKDTGISQHINDRVNDMDIRLQNIQKDLSDLIHTVNNMEKVGHRNLNTSSYLLIALGFGVFGLLGFREYQKWIHHNKQV